MTAHIQDNTISGNTTPDTAGETFDRLYRDNHQKVFNLSLGLTGNVDDALEIAQEAFSRAFRAFDSFRGECSFFTWIYRITLNVASDSLKQRAKFPVQALTEDMGFSLEEIIDTNPVCDPETELLARQARVKCLHSLTECLQANERKVFCLAITLGLPHRVVAEILECSVGSVKTTLHRAKRRWFGYMEDRCGLLKQSNPCRCSQWVRFGLSRGWISRDAAAGLQPPATTDAGEEIMELRGLHDLYRDLYGEKGDASMAQRLREGIRNREWELFS